MIEEDKVKRRKKVGGRGGGKRKGQKDEWNGKKD